MKRLRPICAALLVAVLVPASASADPAQPGPVDLRGEIEGAPYRIVVPANWDGKLLVYAHGYRDRADNPGEVDDRRPFIAPCETCVEPLLREGWALAGSAYKSNGWAVEEALDDIVALTSHFRDTVAKPKRTLLVGDSMGSVPTLKLAERNGGAFDGYIAKCSIGAGTSRAWDHNAADLQLAYDVTFGMPAAWGRVGDVDDDLDFEADVLPVLFGQVSNALNYVLTAAERAHLAALGLDADNLLQAMNARRNIAAPPASRNYIEHYADYNGKIKKPVLTVHTIIDELVPVAHQSAYRQTVTAAGRDHLLAQAYTDGIGHCNLNEAQNMAVVRAFDAWIATGVAPTQASLPVALGFAPGFTPPDWPQP